MRTDQGIERNGLRRLGLCLAACALLTAGCRLNMHDQARVEPYEESDFFDDGVGSRPLPANTVARGDLRADVGAYTGISAAGQPLAAPPFPVTRQVLQRGEERYNVFCSPCHSRVGDGQGMIVQRGFKQPTSFHDPRLRGSQVGYFFNVMTEGYGVMPSYAPQIPVNDRWAIAAYIRVLQYSQNARLADLSPERRALVQERLARPVRPMDQGMPAPGAPGPGQTGHSGSVETAPPSHDQAPEGADHP
ncbi:MAG TPA: cytochrome c [Thermoanaerobaculia bacterium]|nr:cytochrome c [Thermoanaerobaculia bacterium]